MKGRDGCSDEGEGLETRVPVACGGRRGGGRKAARREGSSWEGASCARHRCHTGTVVTGAGAAQKEHSTPGPAAPMPGLSAIHLFTRRTLIHLFTEHF